MDAVLFFYAIVLIWVAPALAYPLLGRERPENEEHWLAILVYASWPGLLAYLWHCCRDRVDPR